MNKYIRSRDKLVTLIKEIFGVCEFSIDSKAIVLLLAGTLPRRQFASWLDQITALKRINSQLKQINALRHEFGEGFRNYIILRALQIPEQQISSKELQKLIQNSKNSILNQELDIVKFDLDVVLCKEELARIQPAIEMVRERIHNRLHCIDILSSQFILNAYLECRKNCNADFSAQVVRQAIYEELIAAHLDPEVALTESKNLLLRSVKIFNTKSVLLFTKSKATSANS